MSVSRNVVYLPLRLVRAYMGCYIDTIQLPDVDCTYKQSRDALTSQGDGIYLCVILRRWKRHGSNIQILLLSQSVMNKSPLGSAGDLTRMIELSVV